MAHGVELPREMVESIRRSEMFPALVPLAPSTVYDALLTARLSTPTSAMRNVSAPVTILRGEQTFPMLVTAADRLAAAAGYSHRDRLLVTALLHDVGKLVLVHAYPGYPKQVHGPARTPEERLHYERRELGVDHALVGGVLARRWNLPASQTSSLRMYEMKKAMRTHGNP